LAYAAGDGVLNLGRGLLAIIVLVGSSAWAQTGYTGVREPGEPRVQWDYNVFGPPPGGPFRLEVYYKLFNDGLTYRKQAEQYLAIYEIEVVVYRDKEQVAGTTFEEQYRVESFPRTRSRTDFLINQLNISLEEPGDYKLVLRLRDVQSSQVSESEFPVKIPKKRTDWYMTSFEFARLIEHAVDTSQFSKSGWLVIPSVSRGYGGQGQLELPIYAEIYGPKESAGTPIRISLAAQGPLGELMLDTVIETSSLGRVTPLVTSLQVAHLVPGEYDIDIQLATGSEATKRMSRTSRFAIIWSLSALLRTDFETAVEQLRYIASDAERDSLLHAPESLRVERWELFWRPRDPTPTTPINEYRDEYYRRLRYANSAFTVGNRAGWRTDRGMIYIQYGEPDEVERHPFDMDGFPYNAPWQEWRYYSDNLRFVFVDRRGSGDYELQYPYDGEYWRRN
jgi:GWxTD domain-containing protein